MGLTLGWRGQKDQWIWRLKKKEAIWPEYQRENQWEKKNRASSTSDTVTKDLMSVSLESQERGGKM